MAEGRGGEAFFRVPRRSRHRSSHRLPALGVSCSHAQQSTAHLGPGTMRNDQQFATCTECPHQTLDLTISYLLNSLSDTLPLLFPGTSKVPSSNNELVASRCCAHDSHQSGAGEMAEETYDFGERDSYTRTLTAVELVLLQTEFHRRWIGSSLVWIGRGRVEGRTMSILGVGSKVDTNQQLERHETADLRT